MPYFNLMSAINLYVAVDWQGDREIERARGKGGNCRGRREARKERKSAGDGKMEKKKERERDSKLRRARKGNIKEDENTQATDTPFLLIEIQFEREASPAIPRESNYPGIIEKRTIPTRARFVYTTHSTASFAHQARFAINARKIAMYLVACNKKKQLQNCIFLKLFCFFKIQSVISRSDSQSFVPFGANFIKLTIIIDNNVCVMRSI